MRRSLLAALAVAVLGACAGSDTAVDRADTPSTTTEAAVDDSGTTTTADAEAPDIEWEPCDAAECATVTVPLDHDEPAGATIDVSVLRLPARGDRLGALFVNFGGPGSGAVDVLGHFPFPDEIRERFDVVAVDPRGVGGSSPLACGVDPGSLYEVDPTVEDDADAAALVELSVSYAEDCQATSGELLPHVGTRDVARDLDLVRAAMGDDRLDFLGYSYGTAIGQAYAELFPDRIRTMVLDGVVDPAPTGIEAAVQQARGFETALARWAADCGDRPTCSFDDPIAAVDEVLARAETGIPAAGDAVGSGEVAIGLVMPLYGTGLWPALDDAVAEALGGDGAEVLALAEQYLRLVEFSAYFAVSCLDSTWPETAAEHLAAAEAAAAEAPRFGEAIVNDYLRCAVWPEDPDPLGPITARGAPPLLVVSTTGDPATPHGNAVTVASRLDSGVLLTHEGDGHTIVFQGDECVDEAVVDYFVDQIVPPEGSRC